MICVTGVRAEVEFEMECITVRLGDRQRGTQVPAVETGYQFESNSQSEDSVPRCGLANGADRSVFYNPQDICADSEVAESYVNMADRTEICRAVKK